MKLKPFTFENLKTDEKWNNYQSKVFTKNLLNEVREGRNSIFGQVKLMCLKSNAEVIKTIYFKLYIHTIIKL